MSKPLLATAVVALAAAFVLPPSVAMAEAVDRFFSTGPYECMRQNLMGEWRVIGDTKGTITIQVFERSLDRTGAVFSGNEWQVNASELSAPLNLTNQYNQAKWRISNLLDGEPLIEPLQPNGSAVKDCTPVFSIAEPAEVRFQAVLTLLDTQKPTPDEALRVHPETEGLPPVAMLPELEQSAVRDDLQRKVSGFWERYSEHSMSRAADTSDSKIISGLDAMLVSVDGGQKRWHGDLLSNVIGSRVAAILAAGQDPLTNATSPEQFCMRLDNFEGANQWSDNLRTFTGVPIDSWDEAFAETYLQAATACDKPDYFTRTVAQKWPEILKLQQGRAMLAEQAERIANMEITLAGAAAESWFDLSRETVSQYRDMGLGADEVTTTLDPILAKQRTEAVPVLGAELSRGGADLPLEDMPTYCNAKRRELPVARFQQASILPAVGAACEVVLAETYESRAIEIIEQRQAELLDMDDTIEALIANNSFSVTSALPRLNRASGAFDAANRQIAAAVTEADTVLGDKRQAIFDVVNGEIGDVLQISNVEEARVALGQLCGPIYSVYDNRIAPLQDACRSTASVLDVRRNREMCEQTWSNFEAPDGFRSGRIRLPGSSSPVSIETMVCSPEFRELGFEVADNSGFFRTEYVLQREDVFGGTPVKFTAVLNSPGSGSREWTLTEPELNGSPLSSPEYKTSSDFMGCAVGLELCFRRN